MKQMVVIALCLLPFAAARKAVSKPRNMLAFASIVEAGEGAESGRAAGYAPAPAVAASGVAAPGETALGEAAAGPGLGGGKNCTSHVCSYGFFPKKDPFTITGNASDENCCDTTCAKWFCGNGWTSDPRFLSNVGQSNEECCDKTCSQFWTCKEGTGVSPKKALEAGITAEECCEPICQVHSCIGNWAQDPSKKDVVSSEDEECCTPSCQAITCESPDLIPHPDRGDHAAGNGSVTDYCCQKTCSHYKSQCPEHTGLPSDKVLKVPETSDGELEECCDAKCSGHSCADGFVLIKTRLDDYISMVSEAGCCEMTCKAYQCGYGNVKITAHENQIFPTELGCCEHTCLLYNCTFGYFKSTNPSKMHSTNRSLDNCCEKSCESHHCPAGMSLRPAPEDIPDAGTRNDEVCCEQHTCKDLRKHRTPTSIQHDDSSSGLDCSHFDESEEKNCTEKYKIFEISGNLTAVPCILDPTTKICKMDDTRIATDCSDLGLSKLSSSEEGAEEEEEEGEEEEEAE